MEFSDLKFGIPTEPGKLYFRRPLGIGGGFYGPFDDQDTLQAAMRIVADHFREPADAGKAARFELREWPDGSVRSVTLEASQMKPEAPRSWEEAVRRQSPTNKKTLRARVQILELQLKESRECIEELQRAVLELQGGLALGSVGSSLRKVWGRIQDLKPEQE